jgi:adenylate cyclase
MVRETLLMDSPFMDSPFMDFPTEHSMELQVRSRQIAAVHAISRQLSSTLDLKERMAHILEVSMDAVDAEAGTLFVHRPRDRKLVFEVVIGEKANELTGVSIDDDFGMVGAVFHSCEGQITNRPLESSAHRPEFGENVGFRTQSIVTVPLKVQSGQPVGVIQLLNKRGGEFQKYDLEVLEIVAAISATAIENARLYNAHGSSDSPADHRRDARRAG